MCLRSHAAPGSQAVNSELRYDFGTYLASRRDMIYARIDGRGTGFDGDKVKHEVSKCCTLLCAAVAKSL